jgi:hypothetical protein
MRHVALAAAVVLFGLFAAIAKAEGAESKKPSVCVNFEMAKSSAGPVAICHDGKKPSLFTRFVVTEVPSATGMVKVLVGFR